MNTYIYKSTLAIYSVFLIVLLSPATVFGTESASYKLYQNIDTTDASPLESASYSLNESGGTWIEFPLASDTFQIVTAPPVAEEEVEISGGSGQHRNNSRGGSSGDESVGESTDQQTEQPEAPAEEEEPEIPEEKEEEPVEHEPIEPEQPIESETEPVSEPPLQADIIGEPRSSALPAGSAAGGTTTTVSRPLTQQEEMENRECGCVCPACPVVTEQQEVHCAAKTTVIKVPVPIFSGAPLPSVMTLMAAFGLGFVSKSFRQGSVQIASKKRKKRS